MKRLVDSICAAALIASLPWLSQAQQPARNTDAVPRLVKHIGTAEDAAGKPLAGVIGLTFALYAEQEGGVPLWTETQNVEADADGRYTATLGATRNEGIPGEVFASGQGRWLSVQAQGQPERPRVLITSVPYALKAVDAETLGGLPVSAFVLAGGAAAGLGHVGSAGAPKPAEAASGAEPSLTGTGTTDHIAFWTNSTTLGSSVLYQTSGKIGLGTTNPGAKLEVNNATATAILGSATATTGAFNGVTGQTASPTGNGVFGFNNATTGFALGVNGGTNSPAGAGVYGFNNATTGGDGGSFTSLATSGIADGVYAQSASTSGTGVFGNALATSGFTYGVQGYAVSPTGTGVAGFNNTTTGFANGVYGQISSTSGAGVNGNALATSGFPYGVQGSSVSPTGTGVSGFNNATTGFAVGTVGQTASAGGTGVNGVNISTTGGTGVTGQALATSGNSNGVSGIANSATGNGVLGGNNATTGFATGVSGYTYSPGGAGVNGFSLAPSGGIGVIGASPTSGTAVQGVNQNCTDSGCTLTAGIAGLFVTGAGGTILSGVGGTTQVFSVDSSGNGVFAGNLKVTGRMTKGSGSFMIDHPLDPANKYLSHSFVESPDMMNVYNGIVHLDAKGAAWVELPDYFEALNGDYRYQLTALGAPAPRLYVAREVSKNRFKIAGGHPGGKVSWQVTGVRHDAYANAHRIAVTEDKPAAEQGTYLHPDVFGPADQSGASAKPASAGLPE